jgi:DNA-binding NtrC family response regulator
METARLASILIVCPFPEHHAIIERVLQSTKWAIHHAASCREAAMFLAENQPEAVICERTLPDGSWEDIWRYTKQLSQKSSLIVSCRLADEHLWAEVLNAGGFNVVGQPFDEEELLRVVESTKFRP